MPAADRGFKLPAGFAIFGDGPLHGFWERLGFLKPRLGPLDLRTVIVSLAAWLPMFALSVWQGLAWGGAQVPFLRDFEAQARFGLVLPLLLLGERYADQILLPAVGAFVERGVVQEKDRARFNGILAWMSRWSRSALLMVFLVVIVLVLGQRFWESGLITEAGVWYGKVTEGGMRPTPAGRWYAWVAIPLFQFFMYRWYFRLLLWWVLLFRVARLDLHLIAVHPDRSGGIGFLGEKIFAFTPFLLAQGFIALGVFSNRIFYDQGDLRTLWPELAIFSGVVVALILGPFTAFMRALILTKRRGIDEMSHLASRYVGEFERKWIRGGASASENLVGSADIQSLADLDGSMDIVRKMRLAPFGAAAALRVLAPFVLPIAPLLFTVIPAKTVLLKLLKILL